MEEKLVLSNIYWLQICCLLFLTVNLFFTFLFGIMINNKIIVLIMTQWQPYCSSWFNIFCFHFCHDVDAFVFSPWCLNITKL